MPNSSRELTLNHQHSYTHGSSTSESLQGCEGMKVKNIEFSHIYMYIKHIHTCTTYMYAYLYIWDSFHKIAPQNSLAFESL